MGSVSLSTKTYTFDELDKKYKQFHVPVFQILVDNKQLDTNKVSVSQVQVTLSAEAEADTADFTVTNSYDRTKSEFQWIDTHFSLGKEVEVKMGYGDSLTTVFVGKITRVEFSCPAESQPLVHVRAMDITFLMMKHKHTSTWKEKKSSDIVKTIGKKFADKVEADDTTEKFTEKTFLKMTDFEIIKHLAELENREFFVCGKTVYFRKYFKSTTPMMTLTYGKHLMNLNIQRDLYHQVNKVIVTGWDELEKKKIESTVTSITKLGSASKTGVDLIKSHGDFVDYFETKTGSAAHAKTIAEGKLQKKANLLVHGYGEIRGLPEFQAGRYIKFDGLGSKLNQTYYLKKVTHTISRNGYFTQFVVGGNAV